MGMHRSAERVRDDIVRLCHAGLEPLNLLQESFNRLQRVLPVDMWFCATVDPATLLYTGSRRHEIPEGATPRLLHNKFASLARGSRPVGVLYAATGGVPARSVRYRSSPRISVRGYAPPSCSEAWSRPNRAPARAYSS